MRRSLSVVSGVAHAVLAVGVLVVRAGVEEVLDEERDVVAAVAQRGKADGIRSV